jgi:hypothetical protein
MSAIMFRQTQLQRCAGKTDIIPVQIFRVDYVNKKH